MKKTLSSTDLEKMPEIIEENQALEAQLTKRNEQYIFDLKKSLDAANFTENQKQMALHEMLPTLVKEQKNGVTARQLYGTVSERTDAIIYEPDKAEAQSDSIGLMILDNFLLLFGMLAVMSSIMEQFQFGNTKTQSFGLFALLIGSGMGALVFYLMYKFIYQYERPGADRSQKPKIWKSMLIIGIAIVAWAFLFSMTMYLPASINPAIDPFLMGLLGVAALGLRYWLKKRFNIVGSLAVPRQEQDARKK